MKTGTFIDIVSTNYDDIKRIYIARDSSAGRKFNEDSFNDAFIKCAAKFENSIITYDDVIRYFWIAYSNTYKKENIDNSKISYIEEYPDILDDDEDYAKVVYDNIMEAVEEEFSENDMMMYSLYKYYGWKREDLEKNYDCTDFENKIKIIHKFVKDYSKKKFKNKKRS